MKLDDTVMVQFFGELIESYRQQIMDQEEARELSKKEKKFLADLRKVVHYEGTKSFRITIFGFFIGATGLLVLAAIDLFYFGQRNRKYINDINTFVSDKFYIR